MGDMEEAALFGRLNAAGAVEDREFLEQKLKIHLDCWAADKWQLENLVFMGERAQKLREAVHSYETARNELLLEADREDLLVANLKLENALDDLKTLQVRLDALTRTLQKEKDNVRSLEKQATSREAYIRDKEAEFLLEAARRDAAGESKIKELQQQINDILSNNVKELEKVKDDNERWKSQLSNDLIFLVRERDFVWNQLKRMEAEYCSRLKNKEEKLRDALAEVERLRQSAEASQKLADERGVELAILRLDLQKAEDECLQRKQTIDRLLAKGTGDTASEGLNSNSNLRPTVEEQAAPSTREVELQRALNRIDDLVNQHENLQAMYDDMEAKYNERQKQQTRAASKRARRSLRPEMDDPAAEVTSSNDNKRSAAAPKTRSQDDGHGKKSSKPGAVRGGVPKSTDKVPRKRQTKRKLASDSAGGKLSRKPRTTRR